MAGRKYFEESDEHRSFAVEQLKTEFDAQPLPLQRETIARVRRLLAAERERGQAQPSYLKRIAPAVYGERVSW